MSQHEVGSVLWIIHTDRPGLMAYRVIEEITKKTLDGEQIQYLVQSATPKSKTVKLETIKGQVYSDPEEAKMKLIENAKEIHIKNNKVYQGKALNTIIILNLFIILFSIID